MHKAAPSEMAGDDVPLEVLRVYLRRLTSFMSLVKGRLGDGPARLMFRTTAQPQHSYCKCNCSEGCGGGDWSLGRPAQVAEMNQVWWIAMLRG